MIDPKELRVGNIVEKDGGEYVCDWITIRMAHIYNPIPLTPEVLGGCSNTTVKKNHIFQIQLNDVEYLLIGKLLEDKNFRLFELHSGDNEGETIVFTLQNIKSLHQLQNLYYSLTGEELNIKL